MVFQKFTVKTTVHIHRLFDKCGFDEMFGRSAVMELLELKSSGASKFLVIRAAGVCLDLESVVLLSGTAKTSPVYYKRTGIPSVS